MHAAKLRPALNPSTSRTPASAPPAAAGATTATAATARGSATARAPAPVALAPLAAPITVAPSAWQRAIAMLTGSRAAGAVELGVEAGRHPVKGARGPDEYDRLPTPADIDHAFDTLPCTSTGTGTVRRFADENTMAWNMVLDLARKAQSSIDFSFFTVEKDAYGFAFLGGLLAAQLRGVQVSGMTDWSANARGRGFTSFGLGFDYLQELAEYGAKMAVFNTPQHRAHSLVTHGPSYGVIGCNHDKAMVIDAGTPRAEGETGGRNIAGPYHQDPRDNAKSWRDDTLHIRGADAVSGLATSIQRELTGPAARLITPDTINVTSRARELLLSYALMEEWVARPAFTEAAKADLRSSEPAREALAGELLIAARQRLDGLLAALPAETRARIPADAGEGRAPELARELVRDLELAGSRAAYDARGGFTDGEVKIIDQTGAASAAPGQRFNEMAPALVHLFRGAREEIIIQNPYVVLTETMIQTLEEASKRGVQIRIVTNSPASTDSAVTQGFFLNDWPSVLARLPTARLFVATGERKFHAKCFAIDGKVTGDLSYNADLLSGRVNGEVGAITRSVANAEDLRARIAADLAEPSNGFSEWTIQRDAQGRAVLDAQGQPIVTHGPEQDISAKVRWLYKPMQALCELITHTDAGAPLRHPPLSEVLGGVSADQVG